MNEANLAAGGPISDTIRDLPREGCLGHQTEYIYMALLIDDGGRDRKEKKAPKGPSLGSN